MVEEFDPEVLAELFSDSPDATGDSAWIGHVLQYETETEAVPFQFGENRYVMYFTSLPSFFGGDDDVAASMVDAWSKGYTLTLEHRLIKFFRVDALETPNSLFDPVSWKLAKPGQIFQFSQTLAEVVLSHAEALPSVKQYFFKPGSDKLDHFYARTFRKQEACSAAGFAPILDLGTNEGGFYGYARH